MRSFDSTVLAVVLLTSACSGGGEKAGPTPPPAGPAPVASVQVALAASSIVTGGTTNASPTLRDASGNALSGRTVTWTSTSPAVASVSNAGLVTGLTAGTTGISATSEGISGTATLTVTTAPVATVAITVVWTTLTVGGATQAQVTLRDDAGATLTNRTVTWSTSSSAIATVTASGLVTAVSPGSAVITATSEGRSGTISITALARPQLTTTNVLMDLSHEFTFEYDIFAQWAPYWNAGYRRTNSHANLASASVNLSAYDITIILQERPLVAFGDDEMQRVQDWVQAGGRVVLVGLGSSTQTIAQLAARFGITFSATRATKPYEVRQHAVTVGVSQFDVTSYAAPATVLSASVPCDTLVADATRKPVAIACQAGAGKVVAISEPGFIANPYTQAIFNVQFTKQLMAWLGQRNRAEATVPSRILPDLERPLSGGSKLRYTSRTATSGFVTLVEARHEAVNTELERITGLTNVYSTTFLALPCPAGGYSGGAEVGVCAYEEAGGMTLVLAHELMHSFDNPNPPPEMMHPVVSYVATKVGDALGGSAASVGAAEKLAWDQGFKRVDPTGTTLDVTNEVPFDRRGKMYWIIGRLEGTYAFSTTGLYNFPVAARDPGNVLKRYYQRKRAEVGYTATPTNTVRLLSIAACRDLFPDFRAIGTTLGATPSGLAAEILAACP
ncbi:MAG: Ig-like domain-containing protein [Gemmatimonadota bacterium]|nr:Ig-like domain-containing protein [Gemmatimonadota bacterium]